jgi:hypothetical protein
VMEVGGKGEGGVHRWIADLRINCIAGIFDAGPG